MYMSNQEAIFYIQSKTVKFLLTFLKAFSKQNKFIWNYIHVYYNLLDTETLKVELLVRILYDLHRCDNFIRMMLLM